MTIIIVGAVLLVWFGTIIWTYALGARTDPRVYICDYCQNAIIGSEPVDPKPANGRDIRMHSECIERREYTRA